MNADEITTPAYVYDLAEVRRCYYQLHSHLPRPSTVYYSVKANPHPDVVAALHRCGAHAEVSSVGEIAAALKAGMQAHNQILFTGPGKRDADIATALGHGVRQFSVDSPHAIDQLDRMASARSAQAQYLLRVNHETIAPGAGLAMTGSPSAFGADLAWIEHQPQLFTSRSHATLFGLHLFAGSNVESQNHLTAQFTQSIATAARLQQHLHTTLKILNIGGGFPAPYARTGTVPLLPGLAPGLASSLDTHFPSWRRGQPAVTFESGRYLTATCGQFRVLVLDVKRSHGQHIAILESGINHLGGLAGLRRVPPITVYPAESADDRPRREYRLVGPLCTPLDQWAARVVLPTLTPGDLLTVPNVGAYGLTASLMAFLSHPAPAEVTVDNGQIQATTTMTVTRHTQGAPSRG